MISQMKCGKCGFAVPDHGKELEVEYKDFKTSELLEIRQKRLVVPSGAEIFNEPPDREAAKREISAKPSREERKSSHPVLAMVGLILALIIGGFFLSSLSDSSVRQAAFRFTSLNDFSKPVQFQLTYFIALLLILMLI